MVEICSDEGIRSGLKKICQTKIIMHACLANHLDTKQLRKIMNIMKIDFFLLNNKLVSKVSYMLFMSQKSTKSHNAFLTTKKVREGRGLS